MSFHVSSGIRTDSEKFATAWHWTFKCCDWRHGVSKGPIYQTTDVRRTFIARVRIHMGGQTTWTRKPFAAKLALMHLVFPCCSAGGTLGYKVRRAMGRTIGKGRNVGR